MRLRLVKLSGRQLKKTGWEPYLKSVGYIISVGKTGELLPRKTITRILTTFEYGEESMRGKAE